MDQKTTYNDVPKSRAAARKNGGLHSIPGGAQSESDKQRAHEKEMEELRHEHSMESDQGGFDKFQQVLKSLLPVIEKTGGWIAGAIDRAEQRAHELQLAQINAQTELYKLLASKK